MRNNYNIGIGSLSKAKYIVHVLLHDSDMMGGFQNVKAQAYKEERKIVFAMHSKSSFRCCSRGFIKREKESKIVGIEFVRVFACV